MKCKLLYLTILLFTIISQIEAQTVTFRFANPESNCVDSELCYDVEAQTTESGVDLDEFNMRMYIDNCQLEFIDFRNPDPNYELETGGTPQLGVPGAGMSFFNFDGDFVYIIDNLQRSGQGATELAVAPAWTYLFEACFTGVSSCLGNPILNTLNFGTGPDGLCPSLVFDHDMDGSGFANGSDGVEALAVNPSGGPGLSLVEAVNNTNWYYYAPDPSLGECAPLCGSLAIPTVVHTRLTVNAFNDIDLFWNIESESNIDKYIVERRYEGMLYWEAIGELKGMNQSTNYQYHFNDVENYRSNVKVYYQLQCVGFNKSVHPIGNITSTLQCKGKEHLQVYPNPSTGPLSLSFSVFKDQVNVNVDILSANGKLIKSNVIKGNFENGLYEEQINVTNILSGQYFLKMRKDKEVVTIPIEILR